MKQLREKWNSQSGVSILLALLFLLVCILVSASVLMAAASNAGKSRSGYEEEQKYLTLSSALRLAAGELEAASYTGAYTVQRWTVPVLDDDGDVIGETRYYHVQQTSGSFTCGMLNGVLDCTRELDGLYAKHFTGTGYAPLPAGSLAALPAETPLTVRLEAGEALTEAFPDVTVRVLLRKDLRLHLTAELKETEEKIYRMEAELTASGLPAMDFSPDPDEFAADGPGAAAENISYTSRKGAGPDVTWKLDWIAKEAAGA